MTEIIAKMNTNTKWRCRAKLKKEMYPKRIRQSFLLCFRNGFHNAFQYAIDYLRDLAKTIALLNRNNFEINYGKDTEVFS